MLLPQRFTYPSPGFSHYWNVGKGEIKLKQLANIPSEKEIRKSAELLWESDILADEVIKDVYEKLGYQKASKLIDEILENGIDTVNDIPESVKQLFIELDNCPEWLNEELLEIGSGFCRRSGALGLIVLRNYCLMGGYESAAINKPLIFTGALKKGSVKRIADTNDFWMNTTGEKSLTRFGVGFKSAVKTRLTHAFVRVMLQKSPTWKNELWGIPLNQADMLATNLGFSLVFMEGLKDLGFAPTAKEIHGIFHLWKYIGFLLGIPASSLPDSEEQAIEALYNWTISQPAADEDTKQLAHSLMQLPSMASLPFLWQRKILIKINLGFNHYFLGKRTCDVMGLPNTMMKLLPYGIKIFRKFKEQIILSNKTLYLRSQIKGRNSQEIIRRRFLLSIEKLPERV